MRKFVLFLLLVMGVTLCCGQEVKFGLETGEGLLIGSRQAEVGPDGNIYVFDSSDSYFKVFTADGGFLRRFGGKGQGPGEVGRSESVRFFFLRDEKTLIWTEFYRGNPWITLMGLDGRLQKVVKVDILSKGFYALLGGVDLGNENWLLELVKTGEVRRDSQYFVYGGRNSLILVDSHGQVKSEQKQVSYDERISIIGDGGDLGVPFVPHYSWGMTRDKKIIFGDGRENALKILDLTGKEIGKIDLLLPKPRSVTSAMLAEWRKALRQQFSEITSSRAWFERFGKVVDAYKESIYKVVPGFSGFQITPEGNFLLMAYDWKDSETNEYRLISPQGKELGHWKKEVSIASVARSQILYYRTDEDGGHILCAVPRRGSEARDLGELK